LFVYAVVVGGVIALINIDTGTQIAHAHATSYPIIRSLEPGEDWNRCYVDEVAFLDGIHGKTRIPPSPLLQ
jgi:hypothetical protein